MIKTTYTEQHRPALAGFFVLGIKHEDQRLLESRYLRLCADPHSHRQAALTCSKLLASGIYREWWNGVRAKGGRS